jgi:pyruvate dehydrogenase E1 component alpha subunit
MSSGPPPAPVESPGLATSTTAGPELVQLLTPEGERVSHPDYDVDLTDDEYRGLYRDLVLVRRIDIEATALQRQGELGIWAALLGQEAAQVGSAGRCARWTSPSPPTASTAWPGARASTRSSCSGLFRGASQGGWDPQEKRFNLYTIVIGSQTLHATGYAMGILKDGALGSQPDGSDGEAVVAYFGDGASSQGDVNEAFVWASAYNAPVVFFCQNNQWGISTPTTAQTRIPLYKRAEGFGFPGVRVDGNDVLASYAVTRKALDDARSGQGPTLIEAFTYRMGAHTTSDDPTRYRLASDLEAWKLKDPLERMKSFLYKSQIVGQRLLRAARGRRRRARRPHPQGLPGDDRPRPAVDLRPRLRGDHAAAPGAEGLLRGLPVRLRQRLARGRPLMAQLTMAKALNEGCARRWSATPRSC